jgi:hypothetical protein
MVAAVVKDNLEMIRFPDIHAKVSASDCCSFEGLLFHSYQACSFCEGDEFFHLVQVMESILRFAFSEHLNNMKAEEYWGPDARGLVFQFEVRWYIRSRKMVVVLPPVYCPPIGDHGEAI